MDLGGRSLAGVEKKKGQGGARPQDGNGYKIPANPWIPDPLGADSGLGLYPRARVRV